jgi:CRP-like cAMP-binding protein
LLAFSRRSADCAYNFSRRPLPRLPSSVAHSEESYRVRASHTPKQNRLLAALPAPVIARLLPALELVSLPLGCVLYAAGERQDHGYFPIDSIVSLLYVMENGASGEIALTGNDGFVGVVLGMGGDRMTSRAVVQSAGYAYRIAAELLRTELATGGALQQLLLRYTQALVVQIAQTAVCNRHHAVEQQLCRWLLESLDRLISNELAMTQELIANMLGVRREGVTEAAGKLQAAGIIQYSRGKIVVVDRRRLEARVCECYVTVKNEMARLLPATTQ